jgi:ACS family D-galactonate transporter-like MFS transporter
MSASTEAPRPTNARWFPILAMVFVATLINYLNRTVYGIARPFFVQELHIDPVWVGIIASAFSVTYVIAQIPGGAFLDKFGTRLTYGLSLVTWSCFTLMQGFIVGPISMMATRLGLGACEAPCFPANSRVLAHWFPQAERARANSIYSVGMYGGIAFLSVPLFWLTEHYGWRALFIITGVIGIIFGGLWFLVYQEPQDSKLANQQELDMIVAGGGLKRAATQTPFRWKQIAKLLTIRQILCASIAQFGSNAVLVFFLIDFVNYLATQRHMPWIKAGIFVALPYIAAAVGGLVAGQVSDLLLKRTGNANLARKLVNVTGLGLAALVPLAILVPSGNDALVILIMSIAFFGQGASNQGWTVISDIAPANMIGVTAGLFNLITNLAGILIPIVIGVILQFTGSYNWALLFIGALPLIGAFLYLFVMGDIKRLEISV